jgi:uncharacterized OB-fold protein
MAPQPRAPTPEGLNLEFYEQASGGVLHLQQCAQCGRFRHPPRFLCPDCHSAEYRWSPSPGRGRLFSWTVTHFPFDRGWAQELPYATAVIELDEGVRMIGAVGGIQLTELTAGIPMHARVDTESYGFPFLIFSPLEAPAPGRIRKPAR